MSNHSSAAARFSAREFAALASGDHLVAGDLVAAGLGSGQDMQPSAGAVKSWSSGLLILAHDLVEAGLGAVEMLIEYRLPLTSKRADVVLAGVDRRTGEDTYLIVELKPWSQAKLYEKNPDIAVPSGGRNGPSLHPLLQVDSYRDYLIDFVSALQDRSDTINGVAYLYNADAIDVEDLYHVAKDKKSRLFSRTQRVAFLDYLLEQFAPEPGTDAANRLLNSPVAPSKQLIKLATQEIRFREQFVLLDQQRLAYEIVLDAVSRTFESDTKTVVIVTGGPGSGKSAIALALLGELSRQGYSVMHATGSRALTETLRRVAGRGSSGVKNLFKYFNSFMRAVPNSLQVLICDEAHRMRESSQNRYTPTHLRTGRPQIDELIDAAQVPVFILDEHQVVRPGEMGTAAEIRDHAIARGLRVNEISLDGQFRAGGSATYDEWVLRFLGLKDSPPIPWSGDESFTVSLVESPHKLETFLRAKRDDGYSARITAGFCWQWSEPRRDGTLVHDVQIGDWSFPWSVKGDRSVGGAPPSALWATQEGGFEQVGLVYNAQGFEYDWNGVILGPDLVYRDGRMVTVRSASKDPALARGTTDQQADRLIRNTYKVLLTRGMVGTAVYSVDSRTQNFLSSLLPVVRQ